MPYKPFEQLRKPKNETPQKTRKPENITEEIRKKEAEKIVLSLKKSASRPLDLRRHLFYP